MRSELDGWINMCEQKRRKIDLLFWWRRGGIKCDSILVPSWIRNVVHLHGICKASRDQHAFCSSLIVRQMPVMKDT